MEWFIQMQPVWQGIAIDGRYMNRKMSGSETTERSKVVERVATASGGYLTA